MSNRLIALLRITLGWIFLWPFFDKLYGFGFSTAAGKSWLDGVSPTMGFLKFAAKGPFAGFFNGLSGSALVDWLFMLGLLLIGLALILGIGLKIASWFGALLMLLMWLALLPPAQNPVVDDHIVYLFVLLILPRLNAGQTWGLGKWWSQVPLVKKVRWLE